MFVPPFRIASLFLSVSTVAAAGLPLGFKPHIIFNLADDVGHYNFGWRGNEEARTPHMDQLVNDGVVLDRHYTYQYCSPTRSSLLSGRLPIHVNTANRAYSSAGGVDLRMTTVAEKLKSAGYSTHQIGKWHAGSSAVGNLPIYRGFDTSYGYLGGSEGHFNQHEGNDGAADQPVDLWENDGPAYGKNGTYNAFAFTDHAVKIIQQHDKTRPLFIYHAWQEAHIPNEVPDEYLDSTIDFPLRRTYEAMVNVLDSGIGNVTAALKAKGMYDKTLIVFSSDNGGREDGIFGGNNYPLRGMKFTDFEGGTKTAAFASGGVIPVSQRGKVHASGLMHVCDWYSTFSFLAGVDAADTKSAKYSWIPKIDSMNLWNAIASGVKTSRTVIPLSTESLIVWPYKLVTGKQGGKGVYTGAVHPNGTALKTNDRGCPNGCLFNIETDPTEHTDISESMPTLKANLSLQLQEFVSTRYQTNETPGFTNCTTTAEYIKKHRGFCGPICYP